MNLDARLEKLSNRIEHLDRKTRLRSAYRAGVVFGSLMEDELVDWNRPFTKHMTEHFENWLAENPEILT